MFKRVEKAVSRLARTPDDSSKPEKVSGTPDGKPHRFWGGRAPSPGPRSRPDDAPSQARSASQPRARPESSPASRPRTTLSKMPSLDLTKMAESATASPGARPPVSASPAATPDGRLRARSSTDKRESSSAQSVAETVRSGALKFFSTDKTDRTPGIPPRDATKAPKSPYSPPAPGQDPHNEVSASLGPSGHHVAATPPHAPSPAPVSPSSIRADFLSEPPSRAPPPSARPPVGGATPAARVPPSKPSISIAPDALAGLASPIASESPLLAHAHYNLHHPPPHSTLSSSSLISPPTASFAQLEAAVTAVRSALPVGGSSATGGSKDAPHPSSDLTKALGELATILQGNPGLHDDLLKSTSTSQSLLSCFHEFLSGAIGAGAVNSGGGGASASSSLPPQLAAVLDGLLALSGSSPGRTLLVADASVVADVLALAQANLTNLPLCEQVARIGYQLACFRALHVTPALEGSLVALASMSLAEKLSHSRTDTGTTAFPAAGSSAGTPLGSGVSCPTPSHYADSPLGALSPLPAPARGQARCTRAHAWAALLHLLDKSGRSGLKIAVDAGAHQPFLEVIAGLHGRDRECACDWCAPNEPPLTLPSMASSSATSLPAGGTALGTPSGAGTHGGTHTPSAINSNMTDTTGVPSSSPVVMTPGGGAWGGHRPGSSSAAEDEEVEASITLRNALLIVLRGCSLAVAGPGVTGSSIMTSSSGSGGGVSGPLMAADRAWALRVQEAVVASGAVTSLLRLLAEARDAAEACASGAARDGAGTMSGGIGGNGFGSGVMAASGGLRNSGAGGGFGSGGGGITSVVDPLGDCQGLALRLMDCLADTGEASVCQPILEAPGGALHTLLTCLDTMLRCQGGMGVELGEGGGGDLVGGAMVVGGGGQDGPASPRQAIGSSCWRLLRVIHNLVGAAPRESCKQLLANDGRDFALLCQLAAAKETTGQACALFASILSSLSTYLQDADGSSGTAWLWIKAGVLGSLESLSRKLQESNTWHAPNAGELVHRHLARVYAALANTPDGAAALSADTLVETLYDWITFSPDPRIRCHATATLASLSRHAAASIPPSSASTLTASSALARSSPGQQQPPRGSPGRLPGPAGATAASPLLPVGPATSATADLVFPAGSATTPASFNSRSRDERARWHDALLSPPLLPAMLALVEANLDPSGTLAGAFAGGSAPGSPLEGGQARGGLGGGGIGSPKEQERSLRREKYSRMVRQLRRDPAGRGQTAGAKASKGTRAGAGGGKGGEVAGRPGPVASLMQMHNTPVTPRASLDDAGYGSEGDRLSPPAPPLMQRLALAGSGGSWDGREESGGGQPGPPTSRLGALPQLDTGALPATGNPSLSGDRRDGKESWSPRSETDPSDSDSLANSQSFHAGELGGHRSSAGGGSALPSPQVTAFAFPSPPPLVDAASVDAMYNTQAVASVLECLAALRDSPALFRGPSDGGSGTGVAVVDDQRRQEEHLALLVSCVLSLEWERELSAAALPLAEAVARGHLALAQVLCTEQAMATLALHLGAGRDADAHRRHAEDDSPHANHLPEHPFSPASHGLSRLPDLRRSAALTLLQLVDQPETCSEALELLRRCPALTKELLRSIVTAYSALDGAPPGKEGGPGTEGLGQASGRMAGSAGEAIEMVALLLRLVTALARESRLVPALVASGVLAAVATHAPADTSEGSGVLEPPAPPPGAFGPRGSSGATWGQPYVSNEARLYAHVAAGAGELADVTPLAPLEVAGRLAAILKCADQVKPPHTSISTMEAALRAAGALAERPGCKQGLVAGGVMEHLPRLMLQTNPLSDTIPPLAEKCLRSLLGVPELATLDGADEDSVAGRERDAASNEALAAFGRLAIKDSQAVGWPLRPLRLVCKAFATLASPGMVSRLLACAAASTDTKSLSVEGLAAVCTPLVKADPATDSDTVLMGLRGMAIMAEFPELRPPLFDGGAADLLIGHATNKSTNPTAQKIKLLATTGLGHLCLHTPCAAHALKAGLLEHFVATASSAAWLGAARSVLGSGGDGDTQQLQLSRGLAAAFRGISDLPGGVTALRWSGAFAALRTCVESSDTRTRLHGLEVCRKWAGDPDNCRAFEKEGAVELISSGAFGSTQPEILLVGLEAACHLAALAEATCRSLVSAAAAPACARAIATVQETREAPEAPRQQSLALASAAVMLLESLTNTSRLPVLDKLGDSDLIPALMALLASAHAGHGNEQLAGRAGLLVHRLCCGGCCGRKCKAFQESSACAHMHDDREWGSTANWQRLSACEGMEEVTRAWPRLQQCVCRMDLRMLPISGEDTGGLSGSNLASP
eukprot:jgi/Mesvir1/20387/Mv12292-RA.1